MSRSQLLPLLTLITNSCSRRLPLLPVLLFDFFLCPPPTHPINHSYSTGGDRNTDCSGEGVCLGATDTLFLNTEINCFTDGTDIYQNMESATIQALKSGTIYTRGDFETEISSSGTTIYDFFTVSSDPLRKFGGSTEDATMGGFVGLAVNAGDIITWTSDSGIAKTGFTVCLEPPAPLIYTSDSTCTWNNNLNVGCCEMAKKIIIDSSVIVIDDRAFMACLDVEEIDFSGATSLTTINRAAFSGMTNLGRVDMGVSMRRYRISSVSF